jgi:FixJ family two-component response regulator
MSTTPNVILVDDEADLLKALERLLRAEGFEVATHESATSFLAAPRPDGPACLVLDESMPGVTGSDLHRHLSQETSHLGVVFLTARGDIPMSVRAIKTGAVDFLTKPVKDIELLTVIRTAIEKSAELLQKNLELLELRKRQARLTRRESEIFYHVASGLPNKQIAAILGLVEQTIKVHRGRVMAKMGADSLAHLVLAAEKLGILVAKQKAV